MTRIGDILAARDWDHSADLLELNCAVAQDVVDFGTTRYSALQACLDQWVHQFGKQLPQFEPRFRSHPEKWKCDIRFFRVGMLAGFIGHDLGIQYIDRRENVTYVDPADLFLYGVIERRKGTCANMAALHAAMARKLGWPVSLACVGSHFISRYDDGEVVHNIEATSAGGGSFASDSDEEYLARFGLPRLAKDCGSDLRSLTARETLAVFISLRARYYADIGVWNKADQDYALCRALFPQYRRAFVASQVAMNHVTSTLFTSDEFGSGSIEPRTYFGGDIGRYSCTSME